MIYDKNHPLRVCTLCSGYDSQCLALKYLKDKHSEFDFDLVAWSEIDKSAITAHNILFPEYKDRRRRKLSLSFSESRKANIKDSRYFAR